MMRWLLLQLLLLGIVLAAVGLRRSVRRRRQQVLQVFLDHPDQRMHSLAVARLAELPGGSIYPELARLELDRQILSDWEPGPRGQRRLYRLNPWGPR